MFGDDIEHVKKVAQVVTETALASAAQNVELVIGDALKQVTETARGLLKEQDGWEVDIKIPAFKIEITVPAITGSVRLSAPKPK
ncbi:MAG: hypothetical protein WBQ86_09640 [Candidatus Binatus sp.]